MGRKSYELAEQKQRNSHSGTSYGYSVEVRLNYARPAKFGSMVLDNRWQEVGWRDWPFPGGIPRPHFEHSEVRASGLLGYNEAEALRWLFICHADAQDIHGSLCLETRIVCHKVEFSRKATRTKIVESVDGRGDPTNDVPKPEGE